MRSLRIPSAIALFAVLLCGLSFHADHTLHKQVAQAAPTEALLPQRILWVWERPEDLHTLDPSTGVAILEQTLRLGSSAVEIPRHQPLILPQNTTRIAVVRIETDPSFAPHSKDPALLNEAIADLEHIAREPNISALQIDFDARKSERPFYRHLLTKLRAGIPPAMPLEITALVSWCSTDDWIANLPINAAIPMFFRMEPDRRRLLLDAAPEYRLHEPLCTASAGVSTTEPWPQNLAARRLFIFPDRGWAKDLAGLRPAALISHASLIHPSPIQGSPQP